MLTTFLLIFTTFFCLKIYDFNWLRNLILGKSIHSDFIQRLLNIKSKSPSLCAILINFKSPVAGRETTNGGPVKVTQDYE